MYICSNVNICFNQKPKVDTNIKRNKIQMK